MQYPCHAVRAGPTLAHFNFRASDEALPWSLHRPQSRQRPCGAVAASPCAGRAVALALKPLVAGVAVSEMD